MRATFAATVGGVLLLAACGGDQRPGQGGSAQATASSPSAPVAIADDLAGALAAAAVDQKPVIALLREDGDSEGIDAGHWLAEDAPARAAVGDAHLVAVWTSLAPLPAELKPPKLTESGFALVAADGKPLGLIHIPPLRSRLPAALAALRAGKDPAPPDPIAKDLHELIDAWRAGEGDPARFDEARAKLRDLVARPLDREIMLAHAGHLVWLTRELGTPEQRHALSLKIVALSPTGRPTADALCDLADAAYADGDADESARLWAAAGGAATGESAALAATARAGAALASSTSSSARLAWEHRTALDAVALVPDLPTYLAAISHWRADAYFPVLFQDDLYAPRFIAAYRPSRVVMVPSVAGAVDAPALRAALLASWSGSAETGEATDDALRARLRELGVTPDGVVFTALDAGELAGGLALAAGRFEGLELLAPPTIGDDARPATHASRLERANALDFAHAVDAGLARWPGAADGSWRAITLAGDYPFRWHGPNIPNAGDTYALDDLLGRDADTVRTAVAGRLIGDAPRSAYQAMCSLFLQPASALLVDGYDQNPRSEFGHYRLADLPQALQPRLQCELVSDQPVAALRDRACPWNRYEALIVTSSGGPMDWSVWWGATGGRGTAEDVPIGVPCVAHMTHSNSAADPYDPATIAGRALWGGCYFWFGSASEPFLESFEPASYSGRRIAAGLPFAFAYRTRLGQFGAQPWRLQALGDPLCCLRREPMRRADPPADAPLVAQAEVALEPKPDGAWAERLRQARWRGDHRAAQALVADMPEIAQLPAADLAIALEECLQTGDCVRAQQLWQDASPTARGDRIVRRYARAAISSLMDQALARGDREALLTAFAALLGADPPQNFVERWIDAAVVLARRDGMTGGLHAWLEAAIAEAPQHSRPAFAAALARLDFERLERVAMWTEAERDEALRILAALARAHEPVDRIADRLDRVVVRCDGMIDGSTPDAVFAEAQRAAVDDAAPLADAVKALEQRRPYFRDWMLVGPFAGQGPANEVAGATVDPMQPLKDGAAERVWKRPFTARDFGFIDLAALLTPNTDVHAYALATIAVDGDAAKDKAKDGFLLVGSDDGVTAWLDGKEIHRNPAQRGMKPDDDQVALSLAPGRHTLLVRVDQGTGGWGLCARLAADKEGKQPLVGARLVNPLAADGPRPAPAKDEAP